MSRVLVTGATGTVGSAVVTELLHRGASVVAGIHEPVPPSDAWTGVEQRPFAFGAPQDELESALEGIDGLFLMRPPPISDVQRFLFPVVDAALRVGVRHIAFLSLQGVQFNRATPHHAVEQHLRQRQAPFTMLRPNFFMQNLSSTYAERIQRDGELYVPAGRAFTAFIDARDVGAVAAAVLTEPGHVGNAYTLSGEQPLTYRQVAAIMTDVLARPIRYARPSEDDYLASLAAEGAPDDYIQVQKMIHRVVRRNVSALPNRSIRRLAGRPATRMRTFVADYQRTWA